MHRALRWYDAISINIFFLGLTTLAQTNGLLFPLLVQGFVGVAGQGGYYGALRLWTLMTALLVQAAMGMLSDRSRARWGRRRPFIVAGTLLALVCLAAIGWSLDLAGLRGYWTLFALAILLHLSANIAQGAQQGLIPDLAPAAQRGRYSSVKALFELPLPLLLVAFTIARLISGGRLLGAVLVAAAVLLVTMLVTLLVPEQRLEGRPAPLDWAPFLRLALMAVLFTALILAAGGLVRLVGAAARGVQSPAALFLIMGLAGLAAMTLVVALGVWACVRLSLGPQARRRPAFTWWVVNRLAFLAGAVNLSTFAVYFIQARLGYAGEAAAAPASVLLLLVGVCILLAALPGGWLADRWGCRSLVRFSGLLAGLGTLVALVVPSLALLYFGGALIGIAAGVFYAANWALGAGLAPPGEAGRFLGLANLAGAGAGAVGAYIGGPLADYFTVHLPQFPGLGYVLLFGIYGLLFLLSVAALNGIKIPASTGEPGRAVDCGEPAAA